MTAKQGHSYQEDRVCLTDVLPLETPFSILIDPSSLCNFNCSFCPCADGNKNQWSEHRNTGLMSYELYRKIIDDLREFPDPLKQLRLYKEGEPLLNKRLPDMIAYAKKRQIAKEINLTSNGSLLNHDLTLALIDAGLDRINLSIEALDTEGYQEISGTKLNFEKFLDDLSYFYNHKGQCHVFMKITNLGLRGKSESDFFKLFGDICDEITVDYVRPVWPGFQNTENEQYSVDVYGRRIKEPKVCPYLFYSMCVNSDGSVSPCCVDWNHELLFGNVSEQSLLEIWNGRQLRALRLRHLEFRRSDIKTCSNCGQIKYCVHDDIDMEAERLIKDYI